MPDHAALKQSETRELMPSPEASARRAGLRYVSDDQPGIRRKPWGRGFTYLDPQGNHISDAERRRRLEGLSIPPAWTDVWICRYEDGHLQATGRDDRGRKQYIYHPDWEEIRRRARFRRLVPFGESLSDIRRHYRADLQPQALTRETVLALAVGLLDCSLLRVGNEQYVRRNGSYGLTTLQDWHVACSDNNCSFDFTGKSGQEQHFELYDGEMARAVQHCLETPGSDLFQYFDDAGDKRTISSEEVNQYLKEVAGLPFTAKDFRMWGGTHRAAVALDRIGAFDTEKEYRENISQVIEEVADHLGNTKAVCRQHYIHPGLLEAYRDGDLLTIWSQSPREKEDSYLIPEEIATLTVLRHLYDRDGTSDD